MKNNSKIVRKLLKKPFFSKLKNIDKNIIEEKTRRGSYILGWLFDSYPDYKEKESIDVYVFGDIDILDKGKWFGMVAKVMGYEGVINLNYIGTPKHVKSSFDVPTLGNVTFKSHSESMEELWNGIDEDSSVIIGLEMRVTKEYSVASFIPAVMEHVPLLMTFKTEAQALAYKDLFSFHSINTGNIYNLSKIDSLKSIKAFEVFGFNGVSSDISELSEDTQNLVDGLTDAYLNELVFLKNKSEFDLDLKKEKDLFVDIENIVGEVTDEEDGVSFFILPDGYLLNLMDRLIYKMEIDNSLISTELKIDEEIISKISNSLNDRMSLIYIAYNIKRNIKDSVGLKENTGV